MPTKQEIRRAKEQRERRHRAIAKAAVIAAGFAAMALIAGLLFLEL